MYGIVPLLLVNYKGKRREKAEKSGEKSGEREEEEISLGLFVSLQIECALIVAATLLLLHQP